MNTVRLHGRAVVSGVAGAMLSLTMAPATAADTEDDATTIDLLSITDFHGALVQAPNIAAQVAQFRADNPDTIFSSAGDSIGGSTFESALQDDEPSIEVLGEAGLEVSAVGNHEFDEGYTDLFGRVSEHADWPYLAANVDGTGSSVGENLPPYKIITTASGVDVAFIGGVTLQTPSTVRQAAVEGVEFTDPVEVTNQIAAELSDGDDSNGEADVVVALIHEDGASVAPLLSADVDVAFAGHSHVEASITTASGAPVVQAKASGSLLGHVQLTVDKKGSITVDTAENLPVTPYEKNEAGEWPEPDPAVYDETVADTVRTSFAEAAQLGQQPVGTVMGPINGASNDGQVAGTIPPANRGSESPLGNLLATAALETANNAGREADFGIFNSSGIRADLDPDGNGVVTYAEAFGTLPFASTIGTVDLSGEQVVTMLEQQFVVRGERPMLALGLSPELTYIYNPAAATGEFVTDVFFRGEPIDGSKTYRVAANAYMLGGGDDISVLTEGSNAFDTGVVDLDGLVAFLGAHPDIDVVTAQQSIGVTSKADLSQALAPGDNVAIDLSSLSPTAGEPQPTKVTVTLDGIDLGTFDVDQTITPHSNETGRTSTVIPIPDGAGEGVHTLKYAWDVIVSSDWSVAEPSRASALYAATSPDARVGRQQLGIDVTAAAGSQQWVALDVLIGPAAQGPSDGGSLPETGLQWTWIPVVALALSAVALGAGLIAVRPPVTKR